MKGIKRRYRVRELCNGHCVVEYLNETIRKWRETRNEKILAEIKRIVSNDPCKLDEVIVLSRGF